MDLRIEKLFLIEGKNTWTLDFIEEKTVLSRKLKKVKEISPDDIRYSQDSISGWFQNGQSLEKGTDDMAAGVWVPEIRVALHEGNLYGLDNRRLFCAKTARLEEVKVKITVENLYGNLKYTTNCKGNSIFIRH